MIAKSRKKVSCEVSGISLQALQNCKTSGTLHLTAYLVPEAIQFNLQAAVVKPPLMSSSHPCNCALFCSVDMDENAHSL